MNHDDWVRIKSIASAALDCGESHRSGYILAACAGDAVLEREVRELLAFTERASNAFETRAMELPTPAFGLASAAAPRHHESRQAAARFDPGTIINARYRVDTIAGQGGMGAVYRVTDLAQSRTLALKTLRGVPQLVDLFKIEFRTLVELRHPHLARSYDFEPIAGSEDYCFTMDFIDGHNILEATEGGDWHSIVELLVQLCRVLAYVHNRGVVHRDLKPGNVLIDRDGTVKLVDFGLVGFVSESGSLMGTPAYLSPELIAGRRSDHRSDLYSLGILLYQLLVRQLPSAVHAAGDILDWHARSTITFPEGSPVPDWLRQIVMRLCAKEPADRFRGANQVIEAINQLAPASYAIETAATRESYVVSGRFVGREAELGALSRFVERRLSAQPSAAGLLAFVSGASGVGKSRLIRELRHQLQLSRQIFIEGNCFEGAAAEYGAIAESLVHLYQAAEARSGSAGLQSYLPELIKIAPDLGRSRAVAPSPSLMSAESERRRLLDTVAAFFADVAELFPYVLYINDLQWAPLGTIEILRYLQRRVATAERQGARVRLAVIGSYRHDEFAGRPLELLVAESRDTAAAIPLAPLTADAMQRLMASMFGLEQIPEGFTTRVLADAAGSPFFLEEVIRALVENGSVFVADGAWRTAGTVNELEIPGTIAAALHRRLAMVTRAEQVAVLRILAAYKKPMRASLLRLAAGLPADAIEEALHELSLRQMVTNAAEGGPMYRTAHDHLRTTIYADLGMRAGPLHRSIANALVQDAGDHTPPLSEVAHHYRLAGDREHALNYGVLAGRAALAVYANGEAIEHFEHVLSLLPENDGERRAQVTEQLADAYFLSGHYQRSQSLLMELQKTVSTAIDAVRIQRKLGELLGRSAGRPSEAVDILWTAARQLGGRRPRSRPMFLTRTVTALARHFLHVAAKPALPMVREPAKRERFTELASIYLRIAYFNFFGDPLLFFLPVLRAANLVDRVGEGPAHSHVYAVTALGLAGLGFSTRALRYGEAAIAEAERSGSPWHLATARNFHGLVLMQTGAWVRGLQLAEQARDGFAACGDHFELAVSLYQILELLQVTGRLPEAVRRAREEVALFERLELEMIGKGLFTQFGRVLAKSGDDAGIAVGLEVVARATSGADKLSTTLAHLGVGESYAHLGDVEAAIDHLERGLAIRDRDGFDVYVAAHGSALLAHTYAEKMLRHGVAYTGALRDNFDRRVAEAHRASRRFPPLRSYASLVQGLRHRLRGEHGPAVACFGDAAQRAATLGARLWQADAHLQSGLGYLEDQGPASARARRELEQARSLFAASGAAPREQLAKNAIAQLESA